MVAKNGKSTKTNKDSKVEKIQNDILKNDILGVIIIAIGILIMSFVFEITGGILGKYIKNILFSIFGAGAYCFPFFVMFMGIFKLINIHAKSQNRKRYVTSFILWFLSLVSIFDLYITPYIHEGTSWWDRVLYSVKLSENNIGGGVLGSSISYVLLKLVGNIGAYIILAFAIIVALILFSKKSIKEMLTSIKLKFNRNDKKNKKVNKKIDRPIITNQNTESVEKEVKKKLIDSNIQEKTAEIPNIKIMDYTDKTKNGADENEPNIDIQKEIVQNIHQYENYILPSINLLSKPSKNMEVDNKEKLEEARKLESVLSSFDIDAKVLQISIGPTITRYELSIPAGIKVNKITNLTQNIALELASTEVRIEAPIPGKAAIGIEVPNKVRHAVKVREVIDSAAYKKEESKIPFAIGKNISGEPVIESIEKMPHMLIAGATGSGKSVCINTLITSILYKATPEEVKFILIDPKVVELNIYNGIPHLLIPVVTDPKKASSALNWAVSEMTTRYKLFAEKSVRDFKGYNKKCEDTKELKMPIIIIIIDELADLMMVSPGEVEDAICRLAQMARAAGIHLIVATQRPSVDVITGTIKANIPSRVAFSVSSQIDSRTILGMGGAEKLLGKGDMLYFPVGESKPIRLQGAFISDDEVSNIVNFLKKQTPEGKEQTYNQEIIQQIESPIKNNEDEDFDDELLKDAIYLIVNDEQASISYIQRRLKVGYARAARLIDEMENRGIVGPSEGSKARKILIGTEELEKMNF